jgi:hypothetical protein
MMGIFQMPQKQDYSLLNKCDNFFLVFPILIYMGNLIRVEHARPLDEVLNPLAVGSSNILLFFYK